MTDLALALIRAAELLLLAIAPPLFSPDPRAPESLALRAVVAAVVLAGFLVAPLRFRLRGSARQRATLGMTWVAVACALGCSLYFRDSRAPLGRALVVAAVPLWVAVAAAAATLTSHLVSRRLAASGAVFVLVLAGGLALVVSTPWRGSPEAMWREALRRDPEHARALAALTDLAVAEKRFADVEAVVAGCLAARPSSCPCLELGAKTALRARRFEAALDHARAGSGCSASGPALLAEAFAGAGLGREAEAEARRALALSPVDPGLEARLRYALALGLERQGRSLEALAEVTLVLELGKNLDASLLRGAILIKLGDLDGAERALTPLRAADPSNADVLYDSALIADKRGDYNRARQGYLAVLKADPAMANARYNLAILTFRNGVRSEAAHHARKFVDAFPADSRGRALVQLVEARP